MVELFARLLGREADRSKDTARERLRLVLVHDRARLAPNLLEDLKGDLIDVISKYMEIDESGLKVALDRSDDSVALVANIPVKRVKMRNFAR